MGILRGSPSVRTDRFLFILVTESLSLTLYSKINAPYSNSARDLERSEAHCVTDDGRDESFCKQILWLFMLTI